MKNLAAALIKAQAEMTPAYKDAQNPHLRNKYASLAAVQESCVPALNANGIAVMQSVGTEWHDNAVLVKVGCTFYHAASGESLLNEIALMPSKPDPQGIGSAITYGRRYLLMAMAGIAPEDDDGNEASNVQAKKPTQATNTQRTTQTPANRHANGNTTPSVDTIIGAWVTPADAYKWSVDGGYTENEHSAKNRWSQIVKNDFAGQCTKSNLKDIMRAYATHYFNKQAAKVAA